jgi:hypothetical protein
VRICVCVRMCLRFVGACKHTVLSLAYFLFVSDLRLGGPGGGGGVLGFLVS